MQSNKKVVIIGSGPAGVSTALYTVRAGLETTIISSGSGSLEKAHAIQNYYGFAEPISGKDLYSAGIEGAKNTGVKFIEEEAVNISFNGKLTVETPENSYEADYVVIAAGASRKAPPVKNLKDFEGKGVSYCAICDAFFYRKKNVAVLGSGEYALHEVNDILPVAASVTLLTNGEEPTVDFPENVAINKEKILELQGDEILEKVVFENGSSLEINGVFIASGVAGSTTLARKIGAVIEDNHIVVDENKLTSIPNLYAVGDCTGGLLQISKAVYEGAVAGLHIAQNSREK